MVDNREEFLRELYAGIGIIINKTIVQVTFDEFKARMQSVNTEDLRKEVLELRKVINK